MASSDLTRQAIIGSLKAQLRKRPMEKIQLRDIYVPCGINRNTLYYHFKDKYQILEVIFDQEVLPVIAPLLTRTTWLESIAALADLMKADKALYTNAMKSTGPESLEDFLTRIYKGFFMEMLAQNTSFLAEASEREMIARFYSHAVIGMVTDWVRFGMERDVREANAILSDAIEQHVFGPKKPTI